MSENVVNEDSSAAVSEVCSVRDAKGGTSQISVGCVSAHKASHCRLPNSSTVLRRENY